MQLVFDDRPVPTRDTSVLREVARSRQHLDAALRSLELALEMCGSPDVGLAGVPISALESIVGLLQEADAALWEAAS
jgi:hypothetical protein